MFGQGDASEALWLGYVFPIIYSTCMLASPMSPPMLGLGVRDGGLLLGCLRLEIYQP